MDWEGEEKPPPAIPGQPLPFRSRPPSGRERQVPPAARTWPRKGAAASRPKQPPRGGRSRGRDEGASRGGGSQDGGDAPRAYLRPRPGPESAARRASRRRSAARRSQSGREAARRPSGGPPAEGENGGRLRLVAPSREPRKNRAASGRRSPGAGRGRPRGGGAQPAASPSPPSKRGTPLARRSLNGLRLPCQAFKGAAPGEGLRAGLQLAPPPPPPPLPSPVASRQGAGIGGPTRRARAGANRSPESPSPPLIGPERGDSPVHHPLGPKPVSDREEAKVADPPRAAARRSCGVPFAPVPGPSAAQSFGAQPASPRNLGGA